MKNLLLTVLLVSSTNVALASLPQRCIESLNEAIAEENKASAKISDELRAGRITAEDALMLEEDRESVAKVTALLCSVFRRIEIQKSIRGRLGIVSQAHVDREAQKTKQSALIYFRNQTGY